MRTIVIDPGHGGDDPGALSIHGPTTEAQINLKYALCLWGLFSSTGNDWHPVLTRTADSAVSLDDRCRVSNILDADLLVSIHANSFTDGSAKGFEIWHHEKSESGALLAEVIERRARCMSPSRGIKETTRFRVLDGTVAPAVLVEIGFMSNALDYLSLTMYETHRQLMCRMIKEGVDEWVGRTQ